MFATAVWRRRSATGSLRSAGVIRPRLRSASDLRRRSASNSHSWRLAEAKSAGLAFALDVEAVRREHVTGDTGPEHRFVFGLGWQLEGARREGAAFGVRLEGSRSDTANDNARPETVIAIRVMTIW